MSKYFFPEADGTPCKSAFWSWFMQCPSIWMSYMESPTLLGDCVPKTWFSIADKRVRGCRCTAAASYWTQSGCCPRRTAGSSTPSRTYSASSEWRPGLPGVASPLNSTGMIPLHVVLKGELDSVTIDICDVYVSSFTWVKSTASWYFTQVSSVFTWFFVIVY